MATKRKKTNKSPKKPAKAKRPQKITVSFDYIKSNQFRVIRVDGVHGGVTPRGNTIQMALFSERTPIPQRETHEIVVSDEKGGKLGKMIKAVKRDAFMVREVEVEALMDLTISKAIHAWLGRKIEEAEKLTNKGKAK